MRSAILVVGSLSLASSLILAAGCQKAAPDGEENASQPQVQEPQINPNTQPEQAPATGEPPPGSTPIACPVCGPVPQPTDVPSTPGQPDPSQPPSPANCSTTNQQLMCLGLKIFAYHDVDAPPVLEREEAYSMVQEINSIWATCDIQFQLERYEAVSPFLLGLEYGNKAQGELNKIRKMFGDDNTFLVVVTGPWKGNTVAWTTMPGAGPFGSILEKDAGRNAVSVAHELGHYQGLLNTRDRNNLMSSRLSDKSRKLTHDQCVQARATNLHQWWRMLRP